MKKKRIRILSVILAIIMGMTSIGVDAFATTISDNGIATEEKATENHVSVSDNKLEVEGTNSFGKMFAEAILEKTSEQKKNNGYNIFSMEMNGTEATVKVEAQESCTLIVAIYDEDGEQLLAAGAQEVDREDNLVSVSVNVAAENMPSYFYLRGFLVDTYTYRPLCTAYESPNYTQQMQEFFAKTTDDFDANRVLNLDAVNDNNFAVYSEDTKVVTDDGVHNQLVQKNEQEMIYVIENADEKITSLTEGDIWAYESDDELIIVKVAHLEVNGTTVTIYGSESSMEEAFAYIKIDCSEDTEDAVVDASNCDEDIQYLGKQDALSSEGSMTEEVEGDSSTSGSLKYEFLNTNNLSGDLGISIEASIKYYLTFTYQYMEICANYSAGASLSVNGKIGGDGIKLGEIIFAPVPGINLVLSVDFILEFDAKITLNLKWGGSFGSAISSDSDPRDLTSSPKPELDLKGEVTFFVGLKFVPEVQILGENIANAKLEVSVGIEVKGTVTLPNTQNGSEQKHNCKLCVNGEINFVSEVKFTAELLAHWKYEYSIAKVTIKIGDWYYSNDLNKFGIFETCDNLSYRVDITVTNQNGTPINGASVKTLNIGNAINEKLPDGHCQTYLSPGYYTLLVNADGYAAASKSVVVEDGARNVVVSLVKKKGNSETGGSSGGNGGGSSGDEGGSTENWKIKSVSLGGNYSGAVTEDGSLYMWGYNYDGQIGNGTTTDQLVPTKILDNVKYESFSFDCGPNGAIAVDGNLYVWGYNGQGQLGNGTYTDCPVPTKILDNVKCVSLFGFHNGAITEDGSLYMWGNNDSGELGNGTTNKRLVPTKILENVKSVTIGNWHSGAITEDGSLYMWGDNYYGQIGDGTTTDCHVPTKILENVKSVTLGSSYSGAITENGNLYMWGDNDWGELGNGTTTNCHVPTKILENVKSVSVGLGSGHNGAITEDGSLYMWGWNDHGELGNGTFTNCLVPTKILENVKSVSLGSSYSGAITEDGSLYMWGKNDYGQLGNGTTTDSSIPIKVLENVKSVSLGGNHSAAITEDGNLYMWGDNSYGQLGNGTTTDSLVPIKITLPVQTESAEAYTESIDNNYRTQKVSTQAGTMPFSDLQANTTYNFYIMKSKDAVDVWQADNLLYVKQIQSDASGNATISYHSKEAYENADAVLVGTTQTDLSSATISVPDLTYNGKEQFVKVTVTLNGQTLVEGRDFDLEGTYFATDVGSYTVTVKGIGMYCGTKNATYSMLKNENNTGNNNTNNNTGNNDANNNAGNNTDNNTDNNNTNNNTNNSNTNNNAGNDNTNNNTEKDPTETAKVQINAFVKRMYTVALGREAEGAGLEDWSGRLSNQKIDGAGIAQGFICSAEFTNRKLNNSDYVDVLYHTFFDREPDEGGKNYWLSQLNKGVSRTEVLAGFVNSNEFANLCDSFHIARGTMQADGSSIYRAGVRSYVLRMYTKALNRDGETVGVEDWTNRINTKAMSAEAVAKSFFNSEEFINRNLSNEDYVETLYQTFMDRASDPTGKADWVNKLNSGVSRKAVLEGFSRSTEFNNIMKSFGL